MADTVTDLRLEDEAATEDLGRALGQALGPGAVVLLCGGLGAGKTVTARGMARGIGVDESYAIVSPTFTLLNVYPGPIGFFHADLYRLGGGEVEELDLLGQAAGGVLAVEWAERAEDPWPQGSLRLELEVSGDDQRRATLGGPEELVGRVMENFNRLRRKA